MIHQIRQTNCRLKLFIFVLPPARVDSKHQGKNMVTLYKFTPLTREINNDIHVRIIEGPIPFLHFQGDAGDSDTITSNSDTSDTETDHLHTINSEAITTLFLIIQIYFKNTRCNVGLFIWVVGIHIYSPGTDAYIEGELRLLHQYWLCRGLISAMLSTSIKGRGERIQTGSPQGQDSVWRPEHTWEVISLWRKGSCTTSPK